MSRFALIDGTNTVVNVIELSGSVQTTFNGLTAVPTTTGQIGDTYSGGTFIPVAPLPVPVPQSVSNAQMRCALIQQGLFSGVDGQAEAAGHTSELYQRWNYANFFGRQDAFVLQLGVALNKTSQDMDDLFRLAGTK